MDGNDQVIIDYSGGCGATGVQQTSPLYPAQTQALVVAYHGINNHQVALGWSQNKFKRNGWMLWIFWQFFVWFLFLDLFLYRNFFFEKCVSSECDLKGVSKQHNNRKVEKVQNRFACTSARRTTGRSGQEKRRAGPPFCFLFFGGFVFL